MSTVCVSEQGRQNKWGKGQTVGVLLEVCELLLGEFTLGFAHGIRERVY